MVSPAINGVGGVTMTGLLAGRTALVTGGT
ncbi:3-oxoacyl-[acyl-carrier-protein] reductase, partial [Staphylococcus simulans]